MNAQIWDLGSRYGNGHYGMANGNHAQDFIIMQLVNVFTVMSNGKRKIFKSIITLQCFNFQMPFIYA